MYLANYWHFSNLFCGNTYFRLLNRNLPSKFELVKFLFFQLVVHYLTSQLVIFPILINELVKVLKTVLTNSYY